LYLLLLLYYKLTLFLVDVRRLTYISQCSTWTWY